MSMTESRPSPTDTTLANAMQAVSEAFLAVEEAEAAVAEANGVRRAAKKRFRKAVALAVREHARAGTDWTLPTRNAQ